MPSNHNPNNLEAILDLQNTKLKLKNENYKIEIIFDDVAENQFNMERGNIYLSSNFTSQDKNIKDQVYNRMGQFEHKG